MKCMKKYLLNSGCFFICLFKRIRRWSIIFLDAWVKASNKIVILVLLTLKNKTNRTGLNQVKNEFERMVNENEKRRFSEVRIG